MRTFPLLAAAALAVAFLSGCATQPAKVDSGPLLSRHITISLDASMEPPESPQALLEENAELAFEYTHDGAAVDAAEVTVTYTSATGADAEVPLSEFTSGEVGDGELVRIEPGKGDTPEPDLLTPLALTAGGEVLAERSGGDRDWLQAGGAPIPIAFSQPGEARWRVEASGSLAVHVAGLSWSQERDDCTYEAPDYERVCVTQTESWTVRELTATLEERAQGTLRVTTSLPAEGPRLAISSTLQASANGTLDVDVSASHDEGFEGTATAWGRLDVDEAETAFQFDAGRELRSATTRSHVILDGDVDLTGSFGDDPEIDHPIEEETYGPETTEFPPDRLEDDEFVRFLAAAWDLDLAVGDELAVDMEDAGFGARSSFVSQVLARETRDVGGVERDVFKLSDSFELVVDPLDAAPQTFAYDYTYWVDAETFLPVAMQGMVERTFTKVELDAYLSAVTERLEEEGGTLELPDDASLTLRLESSGGRRGRRAPHPDGLRVLPPRPRDARQPVPAGHVRRVLPGRAVPRAPGTSLRARGRLRDRHRDRRGRGPHGLVRARGRRLRRAPRRGARPARRHHVRVRGVDHGHPLADGHSRLLGDGDRPPALRLQRRRRRHGRHPRHVRQLPRHRQRGPGRPRRRPRRRRLRRRHGRRRRPQRVRQLPPGREPVPDGQRHGRRRRRLRIDG
jgi:hypothetical protein